MQRRDQRHVQVLGIEPATGATRVLAEQRDDAWVQLVSGLPARGGTVVLISRTPGHPGPRTTILPHAVGVSPNDPAGRDRGPAQRDLLVIASVEEAPVVQPRAELLSLGPRELRAARAGVPAPCPGLPQPVAR